MRKAVGSKKALQHFVLAIVLALGVVLSFSYAFAADDSKSIADSSANSTEASAENESDASGDSQDAITQNDASEQKDDTAYTEETNSDSDETASAVSVTITNNIKTTGTYDATVTGKVPTGTKYVWWRSSDGTNWTRVVATKVTGDYYNVNQDPTKATSINVALDSHAIGSNLTDSELYSYKVQLVDASNKMIAESSPVANTYYTQLQNGSFETPNFDHSTYLHELSVGTKGLYWNTTGLGKYGLTWQGHPADGMDIEIANSYGDNANYTKGAYGATAYTGTQFAELNCEAEGSLYQDVMTVPGSTLNWQIAHKARTAAGNDRFDPETSEDTMYVLIMSTSAAEGYNNGAGIKTQDDVNNVISNIDNYPGAMVKEFTDNGVQWYVHKGTYVVPDGQYLTRYFFVSGPTATGTKLGDETHGNLLDGCWFSTSVIPPNPSTGNVTITKKVYGLDDLDGYKVTVTLTDTTDNAKTYSMTLQDWSNGKASGTINVPAGQYTISESASGSLDNYDLTGTTYEIGVPGDSDNSVKVDDQSNQTVTVTNVYRKKTGSIVISKTVSGSAADTEHEFEFQLSAAGLSGTFTCTNQNGITENVVFNNGKATIKLKHGDTKTIGGIPVGTEISVQEINLPGNAKTSTTVKVNNADDNVMTVKGEDSTKTSTEPVTVDITVQNPTQRLDFTNTAQAEPNTGISLNTSSMAGLLSAAGAGAAVLGMAVARSKHDERKER